MKVTELLLLCTVGNEAFSKERNLLKKTNKKKTVRNYT